MTSEFVVAELGVKGDELFNWAKAQASFSISTSQDVANEMASIVARFPALVDPGAQRTQADPFLIALAKTRGLYGCDPGNIGGGQKTTSPSARDLHSGRLRRSEHSVHHLACDDAA